MGYFFYIEEIERRLKKIREKYNIVYNPLGIELFNGYGGYDDEYGEIYEVLPLPLPLEEDISWELNLIKENYPNQYNALSKLLLEVIKNPYNNMARKNLLNKVEELQIYGNDEKTKYVLKEIIKKFLLSNAYKRIEALISHIFTVSHETGHALFRVKLNGNYSKYTEFSEGFSDAYAYYTILSSIEKEYLPSDILHILPELRNQNDSLDVHIKGYKLFELDKIMHQGRIKNLLNEYKNGSKKKICSILKKEVLSIIERKVGNFRNQLEFF
jgi:hypothetical protein